MRKTPCRSLVLLAFVAISCVEALAQSLDPLQFRSVSTSVVRVEAQRLQGGLSIGSGVTVAPSVVATNCHVVRDALGIRVAGSGTLWNVDGVRADTQRDLCFLRVPGWRGSPARLARSTTPRTGQSVVALGYTGGAAVSPRLGHIRGLHAFEGVPLIEADAFFNSGSSGGGLFDASGALIGLLTFRSRAAAGSYYSLPVQWIRESLAAEAPWAAVEPLKGPAPFWESDGVVPTQLTAGNDFPTHARVDYVLACMRDNPTLGQEALYKCSCAIDSIAATVSYDTWVDLSTVANAITIAGERGGALRDMKDGRKMAGRYREIQEKARKGCFLEK